MHLAIHHKLALIGATLTSALALTDAATHGITGEYSWFADDSGVRGAQVFAAIVHGLTYAALGFVLVREATLIDAAGRLRAGLRTVLVCALGLLAAVFLFVAPFVGSPDEAGAVGVVLGVLMTAGFFVLLLGSLVIGPLLLRAPGLRTGARVLTAMLPILGITIVLAFVATAWAHPGYLETAMQFGLALLGVDVVTRGLERSAAVGAQVGVDVHSGGPSDRSRR